jgi:hypothetical protein
LGAVAGIKFAPDLRTSDIRWLATRSTAALPLCTPIRRSMHGASRLMASRLNAQQMRDLQSEMSGAARG